MSLLFGLLSLETLFGLIHSGIFVFLFFTQDGICGYMTSWRKSSVAQAVRTTHIESVILVISSAGESAATTMEIAAAFSIFNSLHISLSPCSRVYACMIAWRNFNTMNWVLYSQNILKRNLASRRVCVRELATGIITSGLPVTMGQ